MSLYYLMKEMLIYNQILWNHIFNRCIFILEDFSALFCNKMLCICNSGVCVNPSLKKIRFNFSQLAKLPSPPLSTPFRIFLSSSAKLTNSPVLKQYSMFLSYCKRWILLVYMINLLCSIIGLWFKIFFF